MHFLVDRVVEHFWCQFRRKGSGFWRCSAHSNKLSEGFTFFTKKYLKFTFLGTSCAIILKGFALLGTRLPKFPKSWHFWAHPTPNFRKGSHFWAHARQNFKTARTFGEVSQKGSHFWVRRCQKAPKGSHFWTRPWQKFEKVYIFGHLFERVRMFLHFRLGHKGFVVFDHKRHQAKTLKIWNSFLLHFAFINQLQKCIFLVDRGVEHFWCQFRQKGSKFWRWPAHSNRGDPKYDPGDLVGIFATPKYDPGDPK